LAPEPARPAHQRSLLEIGIEQRQRLGRRLELHAGCRWTEVRSDIAGDLRSAATRDVDESYREPRAGLRLRLGHGFHARASAGRSHRTPGFLELFHDGGTIRGNPGLVAETGTRRDAGLQWEGRARRLQFRAEATLFDHDTDNLISLRQAANTYVAMNIGRADLDGQEFAWSCRDESPARRWSVEGNYTHLRALDASTRSTLYTGKELPLQPAHQFFQRLALRGRI
jgi:outer membrane receptor protein involved in Fe transport